MPDDFHIDDRVEGNWITPAHLIEQEDGQRVLKPSTELT